MRLGRTFAAFAALVLLGNAQPREIEPLTWPPTTDQISRLNANAASYERGLEGPLAEWGASVREALAGRTPDQVADLLAPRYRIAAPDLRRLLRAWLLIKIHQYDFGQRDEAGVAGLVRDLRALLPRLPRSPLVLAVVADGLFRINSCSAEDFAALMAGSTSRAEDAWAIANVGQCGGNYARAAAAAPDRAMPALIRLLEYGSLPTRDAVPLYQWLTSPAALARIEPAGRPALAAWLFAGRAHRLFEAGLSERAVALIEGLPQDLRQRVLSREAGRFTAVVDGLPLTIEVQTAEESLKVRMAAAYALAGRAAEADSLLSSLRQLPAARQALACAWEEPPPDRQACERNARDRGYESKVDILLVDHLLHHPDDDPYPLAEAALSPAMSDGASTASSELRCRVFSEPVYGDLCSNLRQWRADALRDDRNYGDPQNVAAVRAALDALALPGFAEARAAFDQEIAPLLAASPPQPDRSRRNRPSVTPAPGQFAELPLPEAARGPRGEPLQPPPGTGNLPGGFQPVRFERNGDRAVMISVSQAYDPTGEASQGGYWVHLSSDGGQHWDAPLYTGLAQNFPYVVPSASRLPMLNGDRLDLEVQVEEVDTASISYPPVAMRSRRQAANLYLRMPLADLSRDSNADGITDIAAHSLLLDQAHAAGNTPFVVGSDHGANCGTPPPERLALVGLLEQLFSRGSGAIVEPVDRPSVQPLILGWRSAGAPANRPIFIQGNPRDFLCLRPNRLMVVYGERDISALERFRPDFHAVEVPQIVYNRAHDRGYVVWSAGWTGGSYRMRLVNGRWVFNELSGWIT